MATITFLYPNHTHSIINNRGDYMAMWSKYEEAWHDNFYVIFRVLVGFLFFQHGLQKLFGWFGGINGGTVELMSLLGLAGAIELVGGAAIMLGIFTRLGALLGGAVMLVAYIKIHAPQGLAPIVNGGELAALYFAAFLLLFIHGNMKWSLEKVLLKKETF